MTSPSTTICCAVAAAAVLLLSPGQSSAQATLFESRWQITLPADAAAPPGADAVKIYVPLANGQLVAVALDDGSVVWSVPAATTLAPHAGETLVFVSGEGDVQGLHASSGRPLWRTALDGATPARIVAMIFDSGWLFLGTDRGRLLALRATDGKILWSVDAGAPLGAPPAPAGTSVYWPLGDGRILATDLYSGEVRWTRALEPPLSAILALDDRLFVGSGDNHLYCLSLEGGHDRWRWRTGGDIVGAPIVDDERVFFMSRDNILRALDRRRGSQRWVRPLTLRTVGGPLRHGDLIMMASLSPQLQAYQRADGKPAGSSPAPSEEILSRVMAPPMRVPFRGAEAFVLLTHQGQLELLGDPAPPEPDSSDADEPPDPPDEPPDAKPDVTAPPSVPDAPP